MKLNEILTEAVAVKKNKNGEEFVKVKCPNLNYGSEKQANAAREKMYKMLDDASVDFTGAKISDIFMDGDRYRLNGKFFFAGADSVEYYWAGEDTENPRGFTVVITKASEESVEKYKGSKRLKAQVVGRPKVKAATPPAKVAEDSELKAIVRNFTKKAGMASSLNKETGGYNLRMKSVHDKFDPASIDSTEWKPAKSTLKDYDKAFTLKKDPTIVLHMGGYGGDYGVLSRAK